MLTKEQRDEILRIIPEIPFASWLQLICYLESIAEREGWQMVPVEPTREMLSATSWPSCAATDYKHMLAAAPKPGDSNE